MPKRALVFYGGWDGHFPDQIAKRFEISCTATGFELTLSESLDCSNDEAALKQYDLIVPCWTMGELSEAQETALCAVVKSGVGLVCGL
ncbi:MAG: ThuA domain-containing protein [Lentimonas sp.]